LRALVRRLTAGVDDNAQHERGRAKENYWTQQCKFVVHGKFKPRCWFWFLVPGSPPNKSSRNTELWTPEPVLHFRLVRADLFM